MDSSKSPTLVIVLILTSRFRDSVFYTFASLVPSDPALASTFASDLYHESGCGHIVYKRISFIKRILPYHLPL